MIPQGEFHSILKAVAQSACGDKTRMALNSVLFEFMEGSTRIVSTDGHRVTVAILSALAPIPSGTGNFLAPISDIRELLSVFKHKSDKRISFAVQGDTLIVTNGKATLRVERLVNETFPDYRLVLPDEDLGWSGPIRFDSEYLAWAIKVCANLTDAGRGVDITTRDGAPALLRPVLDPSLEVLQSLDIYIMPMRRED